MAKTNGQGVMEPQSKDHMEINDTKGLFSLKQHVAEELRTQRVFFGCGPRFWEVGGS
jgi:hypothetical protein